MPRLANGAGLNDQAPARCGLPTSGLVNLSVVTHTEAPRPSHVTWLPRTPPAEGGGIGSISISISISIIGSSSGVISGSGSITGITKLSTLTTVCAKVMKQV